jgi:hypothetical protein
MAVTDIQATVLAKTGRTPTANSVEDAQRYVASSIPKDLLNWAQNASSASTDGSAISFTSTDSIIDVQRNGYSCKEIPMSESAFALSSASLKKSTSTHPAWYHKQGAVHFAPVTDGSNAGYIFYVDYSKIDDNSDLRNIVINYATSGEFTALAISSTFPTLTWNTEVPPSGPSSPSFTTPDVATVTAPVFTVPVMQVPDWSDVENWITTEEDSEMLNSRVSAIQSQIGEYTAKLQSAQAQFNKENVEYQALITEAQQEASLLLNEESQEYSAKLQKYANELQEYQARVSQTVQLNQGQITEWQAENGVKLNHYLQLSTQYYNWALSEVKTYIENNTKTLEKVMELQRGK